MSHRVPPLPSRSLSQRHVGIAVLLLLQAAVIPTLAAQQTSGESTVRGVVALSSGKPAADVRVLLLETMEQALTDSAGRFVLRTAHRGIATLVARRISFVPATLDVTIPVDTALLLRLEAQPPSLSTMTVVAAGEYTLGTGKSATLTPLQVVQTPGAAGNIMRALQTLPGPQAVDEGSGLFVRGGDVTETRVLIDDAWLLSPVRFDNPTGHVTASVNPFLLDRTVFSSGGFGAQYGNALSGLVRLETAGRPTRTNGSANLSIGGAGIAVAIAAGSRLGVRLSADVSNLQPLISVFGAAQPYNPPPRGGDLSASAELKTGSAGRVRVFALRQGSRMGVGDAGTVNGSTYAARTTQSMAVLSWRDSASRLRPAVTLAHSAFDRREDLSGTLLGTALAVTHAVGSVAVVVRDGLVASAGGDVERLTAEYSGQASLNAGGPPRTLFQSTTDADRLGAHVDVSWQHPRGVRVMVGVRSDVASLTGTRTVDPRVSLLWQLGGLGVTAAWGVQHQVAEPVFYRPVTATARFDPMRVQQTILGAQWGGDTTGLRVEVYDKQYRNLWQFTRDFGVVGAGRGRARGADVLLRWRFSPSSTSRIAWSVVDSRRTDPQTGRDAPALGDVRNSVSWITDRTLGRLTIGTAFRYATGRPFTDVIGVASGEPIWGAPNAERLPGYTRTDLSCSWYRPLDARRGVVLWGSVSNVFNRNNVMRYRWTADFQERLPVRAPFNRAIYAGATLLY
jgi:vitamin B12 transporter